MLPVRCDACGEWTLPGRVLHWCPLADLEAGCAARTAPRGAAGGGRSSRLTEAQQAARAALWEGDR